MAVLWVRQEDAEAPWGIVALGDHDGLVLTGEATQPVRRPQDGEPGNGQVSLLRHGTAGSEEWVLVAGGTRSARVNGVPVCLGMRALGHKDEIAIDCQRAFFSTERMARVEPFPGAERPVFCPRCKLEIEKGTPAVRCPNPECGLWHHESTELNCWTYTPQCSTCSQETELGGDYRWIPEA